MDKAWGGLNLGVCSHHNATELPFHTKDIVGLILACNQGGEDDTSCIVRFVHGAIAKGSRQFIFCHACAVSFVY